jgi:phosphoglycerate dehydrogenase-like enzyme
MTGSIQVLVLDAEYSAIAGEVSARFPNLDIRYCGPDENDLYGSASGCEAVVAKAAVLDGPSIRRLKQLRTVVKLGRNWSNVDVETLNALGISFKIVPRKGPNCVAELAMAVILALSKDLLVSHKAVAEGAYYLRGLQPELSSQSKMAFHWMGNQRVHEVRGRTLGIIGMGEIGFELAHRAVAMGMDVTYTKRQRLSDAVERGIRATFRELADLLRESDYVCLAVPHTVETEGMIGADELPLMKPGAYLVNVCRGGVVEEEALITALTEGRIAGAALDVFTYEPLPADSPLCRLENVILTPHIGGGTGTSPALELAEALDEAQRDLLRGRVAKSELGS